MYSCVIPAFRVGVSRPRSVTTIPTFPVHRHISLRRAGPAAKNELLKAGFDACGAGGCKKLPLDYFRLTLAIGVGIPAAGYDNNQALLWGDN